MHRKRDKRSQQKDGFASEALTGASDEDHVAEFNCMRGWPPHSSARERHSPCEAQHMEQRETEKQQFSATVKHDVVCETTAGAAELWRKRPTRAARVREKEWWCGRPPDHAQHVKSVTGRACVKGNPCKQGLAPRTTRSVKEQGDSTRRAVKVPENNVKDDQSEAKVQNEAMGE